MMLISKDMTALIVLPLKGGGNILIDAHEIDYIRDGDDEGNGSHLHLRGNDYIFLVARSVEGVMHSIKEQAYNYKAVDR